jgi:hypothetical protein
VAEIDARDFIPLRAVADRAVGTIETASVLDIDWGEAVLGKKAPGGEQQAAKESNHTNQGNNNFSGQTLC